MLAIPSVGSLLRMTSSFRGPSSFSQKVPTRFSTNSGTSWLVCKGNTTKARDLVSDLNRLVESGNRFTRFVTDFLQKVFSGTPPVEREIKLQVQDYLGTDALLCALEIDSAKVLLAGKSGT